MIGQKYLKKYVQTLIDEDNFPRFSIFVGPKGSGKKTFVPEIAGQLLANYVKAFDTKVDTIREIIIEAYKVVSPTVYFIPDADNMSNAAKNALLKVTEEPPNNAYFIMTLEDEVNTLETIRSRAQIFYMDMYFSKDLRDYADVIGIKDEEELKIIADVCTTPGDINILCKQGVKDFYDYTKLVLENVADVSLANALKIPDKLALKDGDDGYDLRLFLRMFMSLCIANQVNVRWVEYTSRCLTKMRIKGLNKQMLLDTWILSLRGLITV